MVSRAAAAWVVCITSLWRVFFFPPAIVVFYPLGCKSAVEAQVVLTSAVVASVEDLGCAFFVPTFVCRRVMETVLEVVSSCLAVFAIRRRWQCGALVARMAPTIAVGAVLRLPFVISFFISPLIVLLLFLVHHALGAWMLAVLFVVLDTVADAALAWWSGMVVIVQFVHGAVGRLVG